jgi:hypothetical protein
MTANALMVALFVKFLHQIWLLHKVTDYRGIPIGTASVADAVLETAGSLYSYRTLACLTSAAMVLSFISLEDQQTSICQIS